MQNPNNPPNWGIVWILLSCNSIWVSPLSCINRKRNLWQTINRVFLNYAVGCFLLSLIACTSDCVYQQDGYCALERAVSCGLPSDVEPCVNFVPRYRAHKLPSATERPPELL